VPFGSFTTSPTNTINQSGLSTGYTSLVTDFDAYIAGNPSHDNNLSTIWSSDPTTITGNFDFALGSSFTIQSLALWGNFDGALGVDTPKEFGLFADDNAGFASPTFLGNFIANIPIANPVSPQVFSFLPTDASFVRMQITSNNGGTNFTRFGEAAFEVQDAQSVPEPSSLAQLALASLVGLGLAARRKRKPTDTAPVALA